VTDSDVALGGRSGRPTKETVQGGRTGSHPRQLPTRTLGNPPIPPWSGFGINKGGHGGRSGRLSKVADSDVALGGRSGRPTKEAVQGGRTGSHPSRLPTRTLGTLRSLPGQALASTKAAMGGAQGGKPKRPYRDAVQGVTQGDCPRWPPRKTAPETTQGDCPVRLSTEIVQEDRPGRHPKEIAQGGCSRRLSKVTAKGKCLRKPSREAATRDCQSRLPRRLPRKVAKGVFREATWDATLGGTSEPLQGDRTSQEGHPRLAGRGPAGSMRDDTASP
jgi:hypothetical protein